MKILEEEGFILLALAMPTLIIFIAYMDGRI
jgi:hypothetical protein